ncbi:unnamed protein product [Bathycoccus prasinos]|jgi:hypothetical protein
MQTSTTVVTSLKRVSADADALMVALESRIQSSAHALAVREESSTAFTATATTSHEFDLRLPQSKTNVKRDAKKADKHFRKGLELLRRRQSRREEEDSLSSLEQRRKEQKRAAKEALGEFEKAIECCPLEAIRARETLENARERAMEMVYSSRGNNADDDDDEEEEEEKEVDVDERNDTSSNKRKDEEKRNDDDDDDGADEAPSTTPSGKSDRARAAKREISNTGTTTTTATTTTTIRRREEIEELYDASRWLLRSTPRDGREAVRLLKMAERMLRDEEEDGGEFLDDRDRKEIQIAKEKIERAIKHVKR